jgi:GDSL-like Lipase/Acylhydrolase family
MTSSANGHYVCMVAHTGRPTWTGFLALPLLRITMVRVGTLDRDGAVRDVLTSGSMIDVTAPDNGCRSYRQYVGGLHVSYQGSQLQYAERYVAANPRTKFVSLMIGANDLLLLQNSCASAGDVNSCISDGLPGLLIALQTNLTTIYTGLRAAGFKGDFVAVTYYSTNYGDPFVTQAVGAVDQVLAGVTKAFGGKVADGFGAFKAAAAPSGDTCAAGLLIRLTTNTCNIHPSSAGAALLASALYAAEGR